MRGYYILSYDIVDQKRWRKVFRIAGDFGDPLQYSVFICFLSEKDKAILTEKLKNVISKDEDRVVLIKIRATEGIEDLIESFGKPFEIQEKRYFIC